MSVRSRDNGNVHRAAANKLNIQNRATRGSVCNALLSGGLDSFIMDCRRCLLAGPLKIKPWLQFASNHVRQSLAKKSERTKQQK